MRTLDDLLHPITRDRFDADYNDRKPLHIPASEGAPKRGLLGWDRFNALLDQSSIWTAQSLKLVFNGQPIPAEQYCVEARSLSGPGLHPSPAKVQTLLAMGASLIAGEAQEVAPELRLLSHRLARDFAGLVGANVYCSFGGAQAFETISICTMCSPSRSKARRRGGCMRTAPRRRSTIPSRTPRCARGSRKRAGS